MLNRLIALMSFVSGILVAVHGADAQTNVVHGSLFNLNNTATSSNGAWSWFQDERAIVDWSDPANARLIVSSVSAASSGPERGDVDLLWRNFGTGTQGVFELANQLEQDDHNAAALFQRSDGRYVALYSKHGTDALTRWRVSLNPNDPTSWSAESTLTNAAGATYNNVYHLPNDNGGTGITYNFTRTNNYDPNVQVSYDQGLTWSLGGKLLTEGGGSDRPYVRYASTAERVYFMTTERHPRNFANSVYAGYVQDGVLHRMDGSIADQNILDANGVAPDTLSTVFSNGSTFNGNNLQRAWTINLEMDKAGNPAGIISARVNDSDLDHRFLYARYDGMEWQVNELAKAGSYLYSAENDYTGLASIDPDNPNVVYMSSRIDPRSDSTTARYELYKGVTADFGKSWTWTAITESSTMDNIRPVVPKWNGDETAVTWMRGNYTTYTNWSSQIVGIQFADSDPKALQWRGDAANPTVWDVNSSPNWDSGGRLHSRFRNGDEVTFDDSAASTTVQLPSTVTPMSVAFNNRASSYQLQGGGIGGTGNLRLIGGGTVTMSNMNNTYSGETMVARGTLALTGSTQMAGTSTIRVAGPAVLDVSGLASGGLTLNAQTLRNEGLVRGNLLANGSSQIEMSASANHLGNVTLVQSALYASGSISGTVSANNQSTIRIGGDGMSSSAGSEFTYIDATHGPGGNTTFANGNPFNPPVSGSGANAGTWVLRNGLANGGTVYQGGADTTGALPALRTRITGLTPGRSYRVYANFWDASTSAWQIRAGGSASNLTLFDSPFDNAPGATDGTDPADLIFTNNPMISEGNRLMWAGDLGVLVADLAGTLSVYIDDTGTNLGDDRTWYDGLSLQSSNFRFTGHATLEVGGDFYLDSSTTLMMDVGDANHLDRLEIGGTATFGGALIVKATPGADAFQIGDHLDLFDFASSQGQFQSLVLPELEAGLMWDLSQLYTQGVLQVSAVPEPATGGILLVAMMLLAAQRSRNR